MDRHKLKTLNSSKYKIMKEFDSGMRPSQLINKYPLRYSTLMVYYENWKHQKTNNDNPMSGLMELAEDLRKSMMKRTQIKNKPTENQLNKVEPIENNENPPDIVLFPKEENSRIPQEWTAVERKVRYDPFE